MRTRLTIFLSIFCLSAIGQIKRQTGPTVSDDSLQVKLLLNIPKLGNSGPTNKAKGSLWMDTTVTPGVLKYYDGTTVYTAQTTGSSGVTSLTGTTNQVIVSAPTGAVTLSLPQSIATTSSPTFNGPTVTKLNISGAAGTTRDLLFQTSGSNRWVLRTNATSEAGSNTGSPFQILARADDGSALLTAMEITRATGLFKFPAYSTAGILHNDASGNITTSTIATADIANGAVTPAKADTNGTGLATKPYVNNFALKSASNTFSGSTNTFTGQVRAVLGFATGTGAGGTNGSFLNTSSLGFISGASGFSGVLGYNTLSGSNKNWYLPDESGIVDLGFKLRLTASGTGAATTISIPHGLSGVTSTSVALVQPINAASAGVSYITTDATNINIVYTVAPASGTNNLSYNVSIKP